jgi:SNF2 family DNA or RNA helicase
MLVICPRTLMVPTWMKEIKNAMPHATVAVLDGDKAKRLRTAKLDHQIHIINWDGVEVAYDQLKLNKYDVVVQDESTAIKNINRRWKFVHAVTHTAKYMWLMTGTPTAQSPLDAFGQIKMVRGADFPYSQDAWKAATMMQITRFKWIRRPDADRTVREWMQPAIYVKKSDVLKDLPPITWERRDVDMTPPQRKAMSELKKQAATFTDSGEQISAVHAAALRTKIIQIASGVVYTDNGDAVELDCTPRIEEALEVVRETRELDDGTGVPNNKVLMFCAYKHTADRLYDIVSKAGYKTELIYGDTTQGNRNRVFGSFNETRDVEVIVAVPEVMAHGLTLTAASCTIWFSPHSRAEIYIQANNRMDRPGQKHSMRIVELSGCAAEAAMYRNLDDMVAGQRDTLSGYSQIAALL